MDIIPTIRLAATGHATKGGRGAHGIGGAGLRLQRAGRGLVDVVGRRLEKERETEEGERSNKRITNDGFYTSPIGL